MELRIKELCKAKGLLQKELEFYLSRFAVGSVPKKWYFQNFNLEFLGAILNLSKIELHFSYWD